MTKRDLLAAAIVGVIGGPLLFAFGKAFAEAETHRREAPVRAMLGDESFEQLRRGEKLEMNYLGDSLLAPDFSLKDQLGHTWRLRDHIGKKVIVLNFWTVTCQPCLEELPSFSDLDRIAQDRGTFEVVTVSVDKSWSDVESLFPPDSKLRVLFDPDKSVVRGKFGTHLFPETWIIDRDGVIRLRVDGRRNWAHPVAVEMIESFG